MIPETKAESSPQGPRVCKSETLKAITDLQFIVVSTSCCFLTTIVLIIIILQFICSVPFKLLSYNNWVNNRYNTHLKINQFTPP